MARVISLPYFILGSILSLVTAVLMISGRYLVFGLVQDGDYTISGLEVWGLNTVFALWTLVSFLFGAGIRSFQAKFPDKQLTPKKAAALYALVLFLVFTFFPRPFEFQARYYQSPSVIYYILLAQDSADFIAGNEHSFAGYFKEEAVETYYGEYPSPNRTFDCIQHRNWWWGKFSVQRKFYPILDKANHLKLLTENCKEIR